MPLAKNQSMPSFADLIEEKRAAPNEQVPKIQRLLGEIEEQITHRPLIIYAADIIKTHPDVPNLIYPLDKTMFADLLTSVGESECVDVFVQSPGGFPDATEQLVGMLRAQFKSVHFYVPHTAKSAATMMVCSGDKIFMDHRSELGPIDPQMRIPKAGGVFITVPAQAYLDGFDRVKEQVDNVGKLSSAYVPVLSQVDISLLQMCYNAIQHSKRLAKTWLQSYMFAGQNNAEQLAEEIAHKLSDHATFLSHGRPIDIRLAQDMGLKVEDLKDTPDLQAKIWELYCRLELLFDGAPWVKILASKDFFVGKLVPRERVLEIPIRAPGSPGAKAEPGQQPTPSSKSRGKSRSRRRR
jgi:hypothetical protein